MMFYSRSANVKSLKECLKPILNLEIAHYDDKFNILDEFFAKNEVTNKARFAALQDCFFKVTEEDIQNYIEMLKSQYVEDSEVKEKIDSVIKGN
jgi:hypothetical protein